MAAAQLMAAARRAVPGLDAALGPGRPRRRWWAGCAPRCTACGSLLGFNDLLRVATGKPLDPADFQAHLTARYLNP